MDHITFLHRHVRPIGLGLTLVLGIPASDAATMHAAHQSREPAPQLGVSDMLSGRIRTGLPFQNPPILASRNGRLDLRLTAQREIVSISGKNVGARVYSAASGNTQIPGSFMPPVLKVRPGDQMQVTLVNRLGESTNLHTHGFFISPIGNQDNIFVDLDHGKTFTYAYDIPKEASLGSYWYHPHYHPLAEEQVFGGLSGLILMEGLLDKLPTSLQGVEEKFLGLKDFQLTKTNTIPINNIDSDAPTTRTINGLVQPVMRLRPGETQLWHIGNIGADIFYQLAAPGLRLTVIAEDANPLEKPVRAEHLLMPPGKRYDVLVQAPAAGQFSLITEPYSTGPEGDHYPEALMATVRVDGPAVPLIDIPDYTLPFDDLSEAKIRRYRRFDLSENTDTNTFYINQREFSENHVEATPVTGSVEEWVFRNEALEIHPIHVHVNDMQVMSVNGVPQNSLSQVDTYPVPSATVDASGRKIPGEVVVRTRFRHFIGPYVLHCHILAHEDNGMMGVINVTSPESE